jgi:hypothetical protein
VLAARTKCSWYPATLASSTRHCTEIGHTRRCRLMKAYFSSALSRSTPSLFPGCRAPSSRVPARP